MTSSEIQIHKLTALLQPQSAMRMREIVSVKCTYCQKTSNMIKFHKYNWGHIKIMEFPSSLCKCYFKLILINKYNKMEGKWHDNRQSHSYDDDINIVCNYIFYFQCQLSSCKCQNLNHANYGYFLYFIIVLLSNKYTVIYDKVVFKNIIFLKEFIYVRL